tara:strand:- start:423 stop:665 length:243 start_codon:yes stop_codon:yes gene_type:complete
MTNSKYSEKIIDELRAEITADNTDGIDTSLTRLAAVLASEYGEVVIGRALRKALDKVYIGLPPELVSKIESSSLYINQKF